MTSVAGPHVERFRGLVAKRLGLSFDDDNFGVVREVLARRLTKLQVRPAEYFDRFMSLSTDEAWNVADDLTVTETYFFRHLDQLKIFVSAALERSDARSGTKLRVLSAGCASGEEPYSLAILAREHGPHETAERVSIVGIDINTRVLQKAHRARYSNWSLRETPEAMQQRWFRREGSEFVLDASISRLVRFEQKNLVEDDALLWQRGAFDVVLCRNVLMYFERAAARAVVRRFAESLVPGGLLFLGPAETLRGLSRDFHLCHTENAFYYQRNEALDSKPLSQFPQAAGTEPVIAQSWVEAIQHSADRIASLTRPDAPTSRVGAGGSLLEPVWDTALASRLVHEERYSEAETMLGSATAGSETDPDKLLLRAIVLTQAGSIGDAESACRTLLAMDETSPGGRYLMALCREAAGDRAGAMEQDRIALHADPNFAMPRLHLGLLARRAGDIRAARREFAQAMVLLEREEASRLLMYGGGFGRDALIGLCRAELVSCGGAS